MRVPRSSCSGRGSPRTSPAADAPRLNGQRQARHLPQLRKLAPMKLTDALTVILDDIAAGLRNAADWLGF